MSVRLIRTIAELREQVGAARREGLVIGLAPTMGALHAGHLALIERARAECDRVVVTLFVNPTQFNRAEDFERYPRALEADQAACSKAGVDWLFAPAHEEMYPREQLAFVEVSRLTERLCGAHRPGHFRGVTTVVAKLFHIVAADRAYFGEKDYQQLAAIRRMARDLNLSVEVVGVETVREADGLALSSRNRLLSNEERAAALVLSRALRLLQERVEQGESETAALLAAGREVFGNEPRARLEYLEIVDPETLEPLDPVAGPARALCAAWIGATRLIDNMALTLPAAGRK